jgi:hypothetical protein
MELMQWLLSQHSVLLHLFDSMFPSSPDLSPAQQLANRVPLHFQKDRYITQ